jgi:hypothetical protein
MKRALSPRFFQREQISLVLFHETSLGCVETTRLSARGRNTTQTNLFAVPPFRAGLIHSLKSLKSQGFRPNSYWSFCYQGTEKIDNRTYIYVFKSLFPSYPYLRFLWLIILINLV